MKITATKHFNIDIFFKILVLIGFASFFLYTICSGSVKLYVHPRIIPFMIFASVVMIVIAFLWLGNLFQASLKKVHLWHLLFYMIPLIMAFAFPAQPFDSSVGAIGDVQLTGMDGNTNTVIDSSQTAETTSSSANSIAVNRSEISDPNTESTDSSASESQGLQLQNGVLVMDESNYYECMNEVYDNIDSYIGVKIEVVGFVFNDNDEFSANEFVPARLMMVCCAADMVPVGFLCKYDQAPNFPADTWVKVTGTIDKTEFNGDAVPYIKADSVKEAEKPANEYVYPF